MKKLILAVFLLSLLSCTKQGLGPGNLAAGTKCTVVQGIFSPGDFQPSPPLTIVDVFSQDGQITIYNATDTKGIVWQIPSSDLQLINN